MNANSLKIAKCKLLNLVYLCALEPSWLLFNTLPQRHQDTKFYKNILCKHNKLLFIYLWFKFLMRNFSYQNHEQTKYNIVDHPYGADVIQLLDGWIFAGSGKMGAGCYSYCDHCEIPWRGFSVYGAEKSPCGLAHYFFHFHSGFCAGGRVGLAPETTCNINPQAHVFHPLPARFSHTAEK